MVNKDSGIFFHRFSGFKYKPDKKLAEVYFKDKKHVNSYVFFDVLSDLLTNKDVLVTGISLDACSMYQAFKVKKGQRAFVNKNLGRLLFTG